MKKIKKISRVKLSDMVADELKDYIIKNQLKPGDMLSSEMELAEMMQVSRSSVREGIKVLQNLGIVESRNRKGLIVKKADLSLIQNYLQFHIDSNRIERKTLFEAVMAINLGIIPIVLDKITDDDILKLEKIISEWEKNSLSTQFSRLKDTQFHEALFEIVDNEIVFEFKNILEEYLLGKQSVLSKPILKKNFQMHKDILESLKKKNLDETIRIVLYHNEFPKNWEESNL